MDDFLVIPAPDKNRIYSIGPKLYDNLKRLDILPKNFVRESYKKTNLDPEKKEG